MYERFTDRARKVMELASQEATRLNHQHIGTEHILLGLASEGAGVAAYVLERMDIDVSDIRREIESNVQFRHDRVMMADPMTHRAKRVIEYSMEETRNLNHNYVGTEHLLLSLLREREGVAAKILINLGLQLQEVRQEVLSVLGEGD